ncbi:MAG: hypothetical protein AAFP13_15740 [Pseudomonadota bacterium]
MASSFADQIDLEERAARAKALTNKLVDHTRGLLVTAANNEVVLYSDLLSRQIPRSRAAHAFNEMQRSMHFFMLVRLAALWDKASRDRESIPTVVALIANADVMQHFADDTYKYFANEAQPRTITLEPDPEIEKLLKKHWETDRIVRAERESRTVLRWLKFCARITPRVENSYVAQTLRPFRSTHLAHNLSLGKGDESEPLKIRYGDEENLLRLSIRIVDRLHLAVNGAGFAWDDARSQARRNALELWSSCSFDLPSR